MDPPDPVPEVGPALSAGGSNISSELPAVDDNEVDTDYSDVHAGSHGAAAVSDLHHAGGAPSPGGGAQLPQQPQGSQDNQPGGGAIALSLITAGHSVFAEPRRRPNGVTGSTSTVHGAARQGVSNGDSNAQQAASAGVSFEGPSRHAPRGASEEVHFEEVAGPIRRATQSVSSCRPSREDGDSAEARFEEAEEGEELESGRAEFQEAAGGGGGAHAMVEEVRQVTASGGGIWPPEAHCDDNSEDMEDSEDAKGDSGQYGGSEHRKTRLGRSSVPGRPTVFLSDMQGRGGRGSGGEDTNRQRLLRKDGTDDEMSIGNAAVRQMREACHSPVSEKCASHRDPSPAEQLPQRAEATNVGPGLVAGGAAATPDVREWFERERWELELHDCLRAARKHKEDGDHCFETKEFTAADEKYLTALKYVEFENVFEGEDVNVARTLKLQALLSSASCKIKVGQFKEAVEMCSRALELEELNTRALYRRAHAHISHADLALGKSDLQRALEIEPDNQTIANALHELQRRKKVYQQGELRSCVGIFEDGDHFKDAHSDGAAHPRGSLLQRGEAAEAQAPSQGASKMAKASHSTAPNGPANGALPQRTQSEDATVETHNPEGRRGGAAGAGTPSNGGSIGGKVYRQTSMLRSNTVNSGEADHQEGGDGSSEEDGDEFVSPAIVLPPQPTSAQTSLN